MDMLGIGSLQQQPEVPPTSAAAAVSSVAAASVTCASVASSSTEASARSSTATATAAGTGHQFSQQQQAPRDASATNGNTNNSTVVLSANGEPFSSSSLGGGVMNGGGGKSNNNNMNGDNRSSNNNTAAATNVYTRPSRESVLQRLSEALLRRSLTKIDLSQRGLQPSDARLVKMALLQNAHLHTLKLGYNNLQDQGMALLAIGIAQAHELESIDLGFNNIGDEGCKILAAAIAQQKQLSSTSSSLCTAATPVRTLYLAGNLIGQDGAMAIADLIRCESTSSPSSSSSFSPSPNGINGTRNSNTSSSNFNTLQKLYLTGNRLGPEGVRAIVEALLEDEQRRREEQEAADSDENMAASVTPASGYEAQSQQPPSPAIGLTTPRGEEEKSSFSRRGSGVSSGSGTCGGGMQELFLGGTRAGQVGCRAVARLLRHASHLRVLSMPNCDLGDDDIAQLALSVKANRDELPLESLQLSFNRITHKGIEYLANAIWGSLSIRELLLDNNDIGDRGLQQLATVLPYVRNLETLDVGFNNVQPPGMKLFMKAVAEAIGLGSLSVSGNTIDTSASKAVAYALGYNRSLVSIALVHCSIGMESRRHITAGIVSNSNITIRDLAGFDLGPVVVTLGFPAPIGHWTNEQVLNFIHSMWDKCGDDVVASREEEKSLDPLHFLSSSTPSPKRNVPVDATFVVEVAKKAYQSLVQDGLDVFSRRPGHPNQPSYASPIAGDTIVVESTSSSSSLTEKKVNYDSIFSHSPATFATTADSTFNPTGAAPATDTVMDTTTGTDTGTTVTATAMSSSDPFQQYRAQSFVAAPETAVAVTQPAQRDPLRKKRIVEWLCHNIQHLNKLAQQPFSSAELWRLHQHYFAPVVNESGGDGGGLPTQASNGGGPGGMDDHHASLITWSVPEVSRVNSVAGHHHTNGDAMSVSAEEGSSIPMSDSSIKEASRPGVMSSLPMLKRKVSYRFLGDAAVTLPMVAPETSASYTAANGGTGFPASMMLGGGGCGRLVPNMPTMPRKTKRARRNRSRISFLPRVKAKLDSFLDVCHEKALVTMRQLYFVEQAILRGSVNPIDPATSTRTHLSGDYAIDAEIIIVDMI